MSVQAYLLTALILAVFLDLGLVFWTRRNLKERGITPEDKRAVYLFNTYSPFLTWLNCSYRTILEIRNKPLKASDLPLKKWGSRFTAGKVKKGIPGQNIQRHSNISEKKLARVHIRFQISANERVQITMSSLSVEKSRTMPIVDQVYQPDISTPAQRESALAAKKKVSAASSYSEVREASKYKEPFSDLRSYINEHWLSTDLVVISLAIVPVVLVVLDRWLNKPLVIPSLNEQWNKIASPIGLTFPTYFLIILFSFILVFVLLLLREDNVLDFQEKSAFQDSSQQTMSLNTNRLNWSKYMLIGSGICSVLALSAGARVGVTVGWWFIIAVLMYIFGWLLRDVSIQNIVNFLRRDGEVILSYVISCLALLYFLVAYYLNWSYIWIYLLVTVFAFANLLRYYRRLNPILWLTPFLLVIYTYRINGWEFSVIGDEYSFFDYAKQLATEYDFGYIVSHIFDGQAVYGTHPFFSSLLQMIPMKLFGVNNFAWRISNIVIVSASLPLFYYFFRTHTSQFTAIASSLFIGASHYLMTFGKVGYNNLQAFFAMALVLSIAAWTVKTKSRIQYIFLGLALGLCFYVYPAALYVLVIWIIYMLFYDPPFTTQTAKNWLVMGGILLIIVLPLSLQPDYWHNKIAGTILYNPSLIENVNIASKHIFSNLLYAFSSFLYLAEEAHFVTVSEVDPLTAMLTLLGLILTLKWIQKDRFMAYMWVSFGFILLLVGASHDRQYPPLTRLFMLLPWFAFFASIGLGWLYDQIKRIIHPIRSGYFLTVIFVFVIILNLHQGYSLSKYRSIRHQSPEMLFLRLIQNIQAQPEKNHSPTRFLFLTDEKWGIDGYRKMQEVYNIPESFMELDRFVIEKGEWPYPVVNTIQNHNTVVIVYANLNPELETYVSTNLSALHKESCPVTTLNGSIRFYMWYSPPKQWLCGDI